MPDDILLQVIEVVLAVLTAILAISMLVIAATNLPRPRRARPSRLPPATPQFPAR